MEDDGVVVVGGGFAGLSAALSALEAGATAVTLLEKQPKLGGNSAKASFGINIVGEGDDSVDAFVEDVLMAGGPSANAAHARVLGERSAESLAWLQSFGLEFKEVGHGAGSCVPRVRKVLGFQLVTALGKRLNELASAGKASVLTEARVVELLVGARGVRGVRYEKGGVVSEILGAVVICSGGFGANPAFVPEGKAALPTTQGPWTLGEGIVLGTAVGALLADEDDGVQIHPTGFVHPKDADARIRILASESLRQAGGILVNGSGRRFCDEKQDVASTLMEKLGHFATTGFVYEQPLPVRLILPPTAVESEAKHLGFYCSKGFLTRYESVAEMAGALGLAEAAIVGALGLDAGEGPVLCGEVVPVIHYSLGGFRVDVDARVLGEDGPIPGLYAAGEAAGGIHGLNRIAGNGLLESVVFGRIAGQNAASGRLS